PVEEETESTGTEGGDSTAPSDDVEEPTSENPDARGPVAVPVCNYTCQKRQTERNNCCKNEGHLRMVDGRCTNMKAFCVRK
ncbi:hypothetical protein PMAYCL1PPCAC_07980, partial [Pristionchus mayeri]